MATQAVEPSPVANNGSSPTGEAPPPDKQRQPSCDPIRAYEDVTRILLDIRKTRQRPLFALISEYISSDVFNEIYGWKRLLREAAKENKLDVLIHSPGGQLTACYMVARFLSRVTDDWEALVPEQAWSGATLICLGSSNVVMSESAQLGPLDPQVASKRREKFFATERQSPLEAFEAIKYLREFTVSSIDAIMEVLTDKGVAPQKALETASRLAAELARPILEKIEPYDLGSFSLDSRLATSYCREIAKPSDAKKRSQRRAISKALVEYYPAHEYAIDLAEAESLRFKVCEPSLELDALFDQLRPEISGVKGYIGLIASQEGEKS